MSLAQNSNASDVLALSRAGAVSALPALIRNCLGSFYRLHDLSFGYFSANKYVTGRVTGCSVLFIPGLFYLPLCRVSPIRIVLGISPSAISATHRNDNNNNNNYKIQSILRKELV